MRQPSPQNISMGYFRMIDGQWHKRCTGPAHDEPAYLPATEKYFYPRRDRHLRSRCRLCENWMKLKKKNLHCGWIPAADVRTFVLEAANRIGLKELALRSGIHYGTLVDIIQGRKKYVQRNTLRKVMLELVSIKRHNERSINKRSLYWAMRRAGGMTNVCRGCGCVYSNFTDGCDTCLDRKRRYWARPKAVLT